MSSSLFPPGKLAILCLLSLFLCSCLLDESAGDNPTGLTNQSLEISLSLSALSGSLKFPIEIRATIKNIGLLSATYWGGCACRWPVLELVDAAGNVVRLEDPCAVQVACPCWKEALESGNEIERQLDVQGQKWGDHCGEQIQLPSGSYTVVATFVYEDGHESKTIRKTAVFNWTN